MKNKEISSIISNKNFITIFFIVLFLYFFSLNIFQMHNQHWTAMLDQDIIMIYNSLLISSGIEQSYRDHPAYTTFLILGGIFKICSMFFDNFTLQEVLSSNAIDEDFQKLFYIGRIVNNFFIFLIIIFFYKVLQEFNISRSIALLAVSFSVFFMSFYELLFLIRSEVVSILMFLISFYFLIRFFKTNNIFHILLTGLFFGFSMLAKIQIIFLFLTILIALPFLINYFSASDRLNYLIQNSKLLGLSRIILILFILLFILISIISSSSGNNFSFSLIHEKNPQLLSSKYIPGYTAGLTFFIAVAATNLFHQGNWQRVYAAKDYQTLKTGLIISFFIIIPIVFLMGFIGMVSFSIDPSVRPDLGFFSLLLKDQTEILSLLIIILGLALTISTVDTLVNAISSLFVVDGKATFNLDKKTDYLKLSKYFIVILSVIAFGVASKGFDILYLFLLADLFCCAFVVTVFYSFYNKVDEKTAYVSIIISLVAGFLMFPFPDFSKSLLVGVFLSKDLFSPFIAQSLLFLSFLIATFLPAIILKIKFR